MWMHQTIFFTNKHQQDCLSSFHLQFDTWWLLSRGSPSNPQISGTSEGAGPVSSLRYVDALSTPLMNIFGSIAFGWLRYWNVQLFFSWGIIAKSNTNCFPGFLWNLSQATVYKNELQFVLVQEISADFHGKTANLDKRMPVPWLLPWRPRSILDMVRIRDTLRDHIQYRLGSPWQQPWYRHSFIQICRIFMRFSWTILETAHLQILY